MKVTIDYRKRIHPVTGTVSRLNFYISKDIYTGFKEVIDSLEHFKTYSTTDRVFENYVKELLADTYRKMYVNTTLPHIGKVVFLNLTQRDLFYRYLIHCKIYFNMKRASVNNNACLVIKSSKG